MNNSKLVNVLRTFSKNEMKEFEKLVSSAYFNKGRNYSPFLSELKKFHPKFDDAKMTPEYIYSKMYPGKNFNKQIIWNMNSSLLNLAEEFLIQITLKKNSFVRNKQVADELYDRKLTRICSQKLDSMEKDLNTTGLGITFFMYKTQLQICKINLRFLEDEQQLMTGDVLKEGEYSVLYFLILISNVINNMNYNNLLFNTSFDMNIPYEFINNLHLDKVVEYAKAKKYKYAFVMEMYYSCIMTALRPSESSYFFKVKELYENCSHNLEQDERETLLSLLSNYCIYKINNGESHFKQMLFEVNLLLLKETEEMRNIEFSKIFYIQALRTALSINKIDWAKKYIEKYTPLLKTSYQKPMRALADSFLALKLKDYNNVIENLSRVKFIDSRDKFNVKSLTLMAYYELGEIPTLIYNIDSVKQFVSKYPSMGDIVRVNFNRFLVYLKKLIIINERKDSADLEKIKMEIESNKSIVNRSWLLEKVEEIRKKGNN